MQAIKNKLVLLSLIVALLVIFVFSLTLFPSVQARPKNLPIAVINEDQGVEIPNQPKMKRRRNAIRAEQPGILCGACHPARH